MGTLGVSSSCERNLRFFKMTNDTAKLVSNIPTPKRSLSYTEPYTFSSDVPHKNYRAGLSKGCCHLEDTAALRMIVVWMATVVVVVFVALVVEIINQEHVVDVGDVITDHPNCSKIGADILDLGGNAVDAAIAAGLCLTIAVPQSASLGGGGIMLIHQLRTNRTTVIDFQEVSPKDLPIQKYIDNPRIARFGKKSVAVPGVVAGLRYAHQKYGSHIIRRDCCGWGDLILKTIRLVDHGFDMTEHWDKKFKTGYIKNTPELEKFIHDGGYSKYNSDYMKVIKQTLENLYEHPKREFYTGSVGKKLVSDMQGQFKDIDLAGYEAIERESLSTKIGDYEVHTSPTPSSGPELLALLNGMEQMVIDGNNTETFDTPQYLAKMRNVMENVHIQQRLLGDPVANREHAHDKNYIHTTDRTQNLISKENVLKWSSDRSQGTSHETTDSFQSGTHLAVMDSKDVYVSMILSLNSPFGSGEFSQGFLLNNAMASFDQSILREPSGGDISTNQFGEGRRPLSRAAPAIAINTEIPCGTRIVTGSILAEITAQVLGPVLLSQGGDVSRTIKDPKLVIENNTVRAEGEFSRTLLKKVDEKEAIPLLKIPLSPVNALEKTKDAVHGLSDPRSGKTENKWQTLRPKFAQVG